MHTGPIPAVVTTDVMLTLVVEGDYGIPVPASFHYSAHEPLSVIADFTSGELAIQWVFARDLLHELASLAGDQGARHLLKSAVTIPAASDLVRDIDTPADLG